MLLIPIIGKISWRNPPFITMGLILINCIIYFSFQLGENKAYHDLQEHYFKSGLLEIEVPRYLAYVDKKPYAQTYSQEFSRMTQDSIGPVTAKRFKDTLKFRGRSLLYKFPEFQTHFRSNTPAPVHSHADGRLGNGKTP